MSSSRKARSLGLNAKTGLELSPEVPVSQDAQINAPDASPIPGSDYQAVDRRLDPDNGQSQSEEPDPGSQEVTSHSCLAPPVDNVRRDFRAKAAVPPKKEQRGSVFLGILAVVFGVLSGPSDWWWLRLDLLSLDLKLFLSRVSYRRWSLVQYRWCGRDAAIGNVILQHFLRAEELLQ